MFVHHLRCFHRLLGLRKYQTTLNWWASLSSALVKLLGTWDRDLPKKCENKKKSLMHFFYSMAVKKPLLPKKPVVLSPIGLSNTLHWVAVCDRLTCLSVQNENHSKKVYSVHVEGCKYTVWTSQLSLRSVIFLMYDAFAQSDLAPLNPDKCNNALHWSELLNARFGEFPQQPYGALCCLEFTPVVSAADVKTFTWV